MKNLKISSGVADQSNNCEVKPQKHDANLQKNGQLYFQVGLILCLLFTYGLFEMKFEEKNYNLTQVNYIVPNVEVMPISFVLEKEVFKEKNEVSKDPIVLTKDPVIETKDFVDTLPLELLTESPSVSTDPANIDDIVV